MDQQPLKVAIIFTVLVIAIIAALTFKRRPEKDKTALEGSPRVIVQKPPADVPAFDERLSRLTGSIESAPELTGSDDGVPKVDLDAPPPVLPENYSTGMTSSSTDLAPFSSGRFGDDESLDARTHRVRDGDTLASLAERFLGDAARAEEILAANKNVISNPELLPIGVELVIPSREAPVKAEVNAEDEEESLVPVAPSNKPHA